MRRIALALLLPLLIASAAHAAPGADRIASLRRGVNFTNWFRFPADPSAVALAAYIGDPALADLKAAGFTFVRLAVDPAVLSRPDGMADPGRVALLTSAVARIEKAGLAIVVELHPANWRLETSAADRARLLTFWRALAPALGGFDPRLTFPEVLNEPVFTADPAAWEALQRTAVAVIRTALPASTIIVSGNDWGSIDGLSRLHTLADQNVVYSFHYYEPTLLTTLGEFQAGLDPSPLAKLPFPVGDPASCEAIPANAATHAAIEYYCQGNWDAGRLYDRIALAAEWGRSHGVPVIAGEFGARSQLNPPARLAWLRTVRQACESNRIGWALWGYDDSFGLDVRRPPGNRPKLNTAVLEALGLPR